LNEELALCLYRVAQESLRNIAKHSKANRVTMRLIGRAARLNLVIEDTGHGFDPAAVAKKGTLGLVSMQERVRQVGGTFEIQSAPGKGTRLTVSVPVGQMAEALAASGR